MSDSADIINFPKIKSPFVRQKINGKYQVTPEIAEGYEWVFEDPAVLAVDKLHGTNICCIFDKGVLQTIDNRTTRITDQPHISANWSPDAYRAIEGVVQALKRGWIDKHYTGRMYGELVGPAINGNIHKLDMHHFVPFDYLKKKCTWRSWSGNKCPKTFDSIQNWFSTIPSLFTERMTGRKELGEGIVFHGKNGEMAKLRRDMYGCYT